MLHPLIMPRSLGLDNRPPGEAELIARRVASAAKWRRRRATLRLMALVLGRRRASAHRREPALLPRAA